MKLLTRGLLAAAIPMIFLAVPAYAQDSAVYTQCRDDGTTLNPNEDDVDVNPDGGAWPNEVEGDVDHNGNGVFDTAAENLERIKCMHLAGGDGMVTMADGDPIYIFGFAKIPMPGEELLPDAPGTFAPELGEGYAGWAMDYGILAAEAPAPTIVVDEDDELFLTLTNVGMAMRPDLFDGHTVHWHGFPEASSVFDGVPDASIAVNMGASLTYYYNVQDAGTYMYHCHVEATEHMQMGMLGNLYVRPRQNKLGYGDDPNTISRLGGNSASDVEGYAYNDGDGSTGYDVEFPIQIGSFDKGFHDASYTVQPLPFSDMKDTYFLLNGRGYPDTVAAEDAITTGGENRQPVSSLIEASAGDRILLRVSNLNVTQFNTLGTNGPAMEVVALDARLLRADDGTNMYYKTNSLTLGGGQSADVIIEIPAGTQAGTTFFLYSTNLEMLANHRDNFGGMMTEIRVN